VVLEDCFGDHSLTAAYCTQLKTRNQLIESLQEIATAIKQLAHHVFPALLEDHVRREAGKAFVNGLKDKHKTAAVYFWEARERSTRPLSHKPSSRVVHQARENECQNILEEPALSPNRTKI
jgi:hypothetical protein